MKNNSIKKRFYNNFEAIFMNIINSYYMVLFINIIHTVIWYKTYTFTIIKLFVIYT